MCSWLTYAWQSEVRVHRIKDTTSHVNRSPLRLPTSRQYLHSGRTFDLLDSLNAKHDVSTEAGQLQLQQSFGVDTGRTLNWQLR